MSSLNVNIPTISKEAHSLNFDSKDVGSFCAKSTLNGAHIRIARKVLQYLNEDFSFDFFEKLLYKVLLKSQLVCCWKAFTNYQWKLQKASPSTVLASKF